MKIGLNEAINLLKQWQTERPERAVYPRVVNNPYGDNAIGIAFDEGWWTALRYANEQGWFSPDERAS